MRRTVTTIAIASALSLGAWGCQKDNSELNTKLEEISAKQDEILKKLDSAGGRPGAARPQQPRPPGPDANAVYAVPIEGAPYKGAEHAKITIVEAFEFA